MKIKKDDLMFMIQVVVLLALANTTMLINDGNTKLMPLALMLLMIIVVIFGIKLFSYYSRPIY